MVADFKNLLPQCDLSTQPSGLESDVLLLRYKVLLLARIFEKPI